MNALISIFLDIALAPVQFFLIPFDKVLTLFLPQISKLPLYFNQLVSFVGDIPSFICYILGADPALFSFPFMLLGILLVFMPIVQIIKRVINILVAFRQSTGL